MTDNEIDDVLTKVAAQWAERTPAPPPFPMRQTEMPQLPSEPSRRPMYAAVALVAASLIGVAVLVLNSGDSTQPVITAPVATEAPAAPTSTQVPPAASPAPSSTGPTSVPVSGPSQSPEDARRDGVIAEVAELSIAERMDIQDEVEVAGQRWVLSRFPQGTRFTGEDGTTLPIDPLSGELLNLVDGRIARAVPMVGFPPSFLMVHENFVLFGRYGDGGYPDSALYRVDTETGEVTSMIFPWSYGRHATSARPRLDGWTDRQIGTAAAADAFYSAAAVSGFDPAAAAQAMSAILDAPDTVAWQDLPLLVTWCGVEWDESWPTYRVHLVDGVCVTVQRNADDAVQSHVGDHLIDGAVLGLVPGADGQVLGVVAASLNFAEEEVGVTPLQLLTVTPGSPDIELRDLTSSDFIDVPGDSPIALVTPLLGHARPDFGISGEARVRLIDGAVLYTPTYDAVAIEFAVPAVESQEFGIVDFDGRWIVLSDERYGQSVGGWLIDVTTGNQYPLGFEEIGSTIRR